MSRDDGGHRGLNLGVCCRREAIGGALICSRGIIKLSLGGICFLCLTTKIKNVHRYWQVICLIGAYYCHQNINVQANSVFTHCFRFEHQTKDMLNGSNICVVIGSNVTSLKKQNTLIHITIVASEVLKFRLVNLDDRKKTLLGAYVLDSI
ncbi:hypothetical protein BDA99DRAFT_567956 [Phascolomyces articulosus]|uniref:Uncharacterized protein n=1 Tax=Phascolomyces articulosus TaxID=60185 RepID=A0AAD5KB66_9FUNG|nr:hypothetical protein BDA99DRAFT_567956 [Phascolomyces articulosus]